MQLSFKRKPVRSRSASAPARLAELVEGEQAILASLDLPEDIALRLMELGFFPGNTITAGRCAPGGDPKVFRVDGSEIALRRDTAHHLLLKT